MKLGEYTYEASVIFSPSTVRLRKIIADRSEWEAETYPNDFQGESACIFYKYGYVFPYDKLDGLRKYILSVKDKTGLRRRFKGYIALDLSEWAEHIDEDYFNIFIMYLADHLDGIHYLLFFGSRESAEKEMILKVLKQYMNVRVVEDPARLSVTRAPKHLRREPH